MPKNLTATGIYPQSFPLPQSTSFTDTYWLIQNFALRDTSTHDNTTVTGSVPDGGSLSSPGPFFILPLTDQIPPLKAYGVWFYNGTDQDITVQLLGNVVSDLSYPNFDLGSSQSVASLAPNWIFGAFDQVPVEYIAAQISAATSPTSGTVTAVLFNYH